MSERVKLLFELLQVSIGCRSQLSAIPTNEEWFSLFDIALKQSITGIIFSGVETIGQKLPMELLLQWLKLSEQIKGQNNLLNQQCVELADSLHKRGYECCILKGQGCALLYPNPQMRTSGDIDVWVKRKGKSKRGNTRATIEYVKGINPEGEAIYHHIDYGMYHGTEVEVHYRPSFMFNPIHNHRLQK